MRTEQMPPLLRHLVALFLPFSTCDHFEQLVSVHPPPPLPIHTYQMHHLVSHLHHLVPLFGTTADTHSRLAHQEPCW